MENQVTLDILVKLANICFYEPLRSSVRRLGSKVASTYIADLRRARRFSSRFVEERFERTTRRFVMSAKKRRGSVYFVNEIVLSPITQDLVSLFRSAPIRTIRLNSSNTRRGASFSRSLFFFSLPRQSKSSLRSTRFFQGASSRARRGLTVRLLFEANTFRVTTLNS